MKAEYDSLTKKWFRQHPESCTTVVKCKEKRGNKT